MKIHLRFYKSKICLTLNFKAMLEYAKLILEKVSFDMFLFQKELVKSLKWLTGNEKQMLQSWVVSKYGNTHKDAIKRVFPNR